MKIDPEDPYGEYLRVLEHLSLAEEWKCVGCLKSVFEDILQNSPVVIRVKETPHDLEKLAYSVLKKNRELSNGRIITTSNRGKLRPGAFSGTHRFD